MRSFSWFTPTVMLLFAAVTSVAASTDKKYPKEVHRLIQDKLLSHKNLESEGIWSEWSPWTTCSRTCGGGVSSQSRQCLRNTRTRRSALLDPAISRKAKKEAGSQENPSPTSAPHRKGCVGLYKRFHMCNTQDCPAGSRDFRQVQCESYNGKHFMGRYYAWEAYWDGENPCELNCRALGFRFYALLNKTVIDGTACRFGDATRVCVAGACKAIGCDGIVGSDKKLDGCGVCGGDNSTCQIVSGIFTEPHLPAGYNLIAQLPRGACHINITVLKPTKNYLALRRSFDGSFIINGNWAINLSGDYPAAGSSFSYRRQESSSPELVSCQGPLTEAVDLMVIAQQLNPGIKYEYMLPLGLPNPGIPSVPVPGTFPSPPGGAAVPPSGPFQPPGAPLGPGFSSLSSSGSLAHLGIVPQFADSPPESAIVPAIDDRGPGHSPRKPKRPPGPKSTPDLQSTDPNTDYVNGNANGNGYHRRSRKGKTVWKHVGFTECSKTCGSGVQTALLICVREDNQVPVPDRRCHERPEPEQVRCNTKPCPAEWVPSEWSACSVSCGDGVQTREVACKQEISPTLTMKVTEAACLGPPPSVATVRPCHLAPCAKWQVSDWGKCSTNCGKGMRYRRVQCTNHDGRNVTDADCPLAEKPGGSEVCDMGSCSTNTWFYTDWTGHCSEECGTGIQSRQVHCAGSDDESCEASKRPESTRTCVSNKDCNAKWFAGPWSHCSATCDEGTQTREVLCLTFMRGQYRVGLDMHCPANERPDSQRQCNLGACLPQWYMSDWSECSVTCGTGAQRREVKCLDSNQQPSQNCREDQKPLPRQACSPRPCPGSNEVVADAEDAPTEATNVAAETETSSVKSTTKSSKKKTVAKLESKQSSESSSSSSGDSCVDKFKNCHLVVQARLCKLKYYLVSCCASCSKQKN